VSSHPHTASRLLLCVVASLLLIGIVAAEFPEFLTLVDDTSNDFVVRKADNGTCAATLASQAFSRPELKYFDCDRCDESVINFVVAEPGSSELFLMHSVLRR
jgi:hypothetical protein